MAKYRIQAVMVVDGTDFYKYDNGTYKTISYKSWKQLFDSCDSYKKLSQFIETPAIKFKLRFKE